MADEILITGSFDASAIVTGIDQAASSMKDAASQITGSLQQVADSSSSVEAKFLAALDSMLEPLINLEEGLGALTPAEQAFSQALDQTFSSLTETASAMENATSAEAAFSSALDSLLEPLIAVNEQFDLSSAQIQAFTQYASVGAAQIVELDTTIAEANGQLLLFTEAAADASGQLQLFETIASEVGAAEEKVVAVTAQTSATMAALANILAATGAVSTTVAESLQFLGNNAAVAGSTNQEFAAALANVNRVLTPLNLELRGTAGNLELVKVATKDTGNAALDASGKLTTLGGALAYVSGRALATEVGVRELGFAFGVLGRAVPALGGVLVAAFPVIGAILLGEIVLGLVDKFEKLEDGIRKTAGELEDVSVSSSRAAESIQLENLKLEDQLSKLEGGPTNNRLKEAVIETRIEVDKLIKSLGDATEKEIELLEKADVGKLTALLTGEASSSWINNIGSIYGKAKDALGIYSTSLQQLRTAQLAYDEESTEGNKKAVDSAEDRVAKTRKAAEDEASALSSAIEKKKAARIASVTEDTAALYGTGARGKEELAKAIETVTAGYAKQESAAAELTNLLKSQELQEKATAEQSRLRGQVAVQANQDDALSRERLLKEPEIKDTEKGAIEAAQQKRKAVEDGYREEETLRTESINKAVASGENREQAEVRVDARILAARKAYTAALITEENERFEATKTALEQQRDLNDKTTIDQTKKISEHKSVTSAIERLETEHQAKLLSIDREGNTARIKEEEDLGKKEQQSFLNDVALAVASNQKKRGEEELFTAAKIALLTKAITEAKARWGEESEAYKRLTLEKAEAEQKFSDQQSKIGNIDAEIAKAHAQTKLEIIRGEIETEYSLNLIGSSRRLALLRQVTQQEIGIELAAAQAKQAQYSKGTVAYEQAEKEIQAINDKYDKLMAADDDAALKQRLGSFEKFNQQIIGSFQSATSQMLRGQKTFGQGLIEEWNNMVVRFTQMLEQMVLKWALAHSLMKLETKAFEAVIYIEHLLGLGKKAAADTVATTKEVSEHVAVNIAKTTSDASYTTAFLAGAAIRSSAQSAADALALSETIASNVAQVISYAGLAGAAAYAATVGIPYVGPIIAPAAMAVAIGTTLSNLGLAAAEKGALLDSDMPIFAHAKEMILPAHISTGLQDIISSKGDSSFASSGRGNTSTSSKTIHIRPTINIYPQEGMSESHDKIVSIVQSAIRKGSLKA